MTGAGTGARQDRVVIFIRNLKTGSTTLRNLITRHYGASALLLGGRPRTVKEVRGVSGIDFDTIRAVHGHVPFGVHELLPRPSAYVTMLRHPVDRMLSLYHFIVENPTRAIHAEAQGQLGSVARLVSSGMVIETDNGQTRRLSGMDPEFGGCSGEMLERAKRTLRDHCVVVGLTERFDETLLLLKRALGWRYLFYSKKLVTRSRVGPDGLSPLALGTIETHNSLDMELYEYAAGLFDDAVRQQGDLFEEELRALKTLNAELARRDPGGSGRAPSGGAPSLGMAVLPMLLDAHAELLAGEAALQRENVRLRREAVRLGKRITALEREVASTSERLTRAQDKIRQMEATTLWRLGGWYRRVRAGLAGMFRS